MIDAGDFHQDTLKWREQKRFDLHRRGAGQRDGNCCGGHDNLWVLLPRCLQNGHDSHQRDGDDEDDR